MALTALRPDRDWSTWIDAWERTGREPYAHPGYVELVCEEHRPMAFHWLAGSAEVLLPLVVRRIPIGGASGKGLPETYDAVSPYGYGGPYSVWSTELDWRQFYSEILTYMRAQRWVTCFIRGSLHVLPPRHVHEPGYAVVHLNDNIEVDLERDADIQWMHYEHKVRKNVKKALREGFEHCDDIDVVDFYDIYRETMIRRDADKWFLFEREFFEKLCLQLSDSCRVVGVRDKQSRGWVASEIVLRSDSTLYSYLGGTNEWGMRHGANDLLKHGVITRGRFDGYKSYVLGGGREIGDGIYRYKRSFDPTGQRQFFGIQLVGDGNEYERLVAASLGDGQEDENFFPAYRQSL